MTSVHLPHKVALVSESATTTDAELATIAAALAQQVTRDLGPAWTLSATVAAFPGGRAGVPHGYWPIVILDHLDAPGALGYHTDSDRQPISYVQAGPDVSVTCSHELVEMLVDPDGNRLWAAESPDGSGARTRILIEVGDPCEAITYKINGVKVSDFALPRFFHTVHGAGAYSLTGALKTPRKILRGGYISYQDLGGVWHQQTWFDGAKPKTTRLGAMADFAHPNESIREAVDRVTRSARSA